MGVNRSHIHAGFTVYHMHELNLEELQYAESITRLTPVSMAVCLAGRKNPCMGGVGLCEECTMHVQVQFHCQHKVPIGILKP